MKVKSLSHVQLFATPWTIAYQAPPSMGSSRQEYWSELPFPYPGDLPDPGIELRSPALQADALPSEPPGKTHFYFFRIKNFTSHMETQKTQIAKEVLRKKNGAGGINLPDYRLY